MSNASPLPKIIDSIDEPFFCLRRSRIMRPKQKPLAIETAIPVRSWRRRPSKRKTPMPIKVARIVHQSAREARSPSSQVPKSATQTGAVYCSSIALAAVVSLLAAAKRMVQPAKATAAPSCRGDHVKRKVRQHTLSKNRAAIPPRPPATARLGQSTDLRRTPPRLQQRAANSKRPTDFR